MTKFFQILTALVGIAMSIGYFPQAYKIWKTKSANNVSLVAFTIFAVGTLIWTLYGFFLKDLVLILSFAVGVVGSWSVLFLAIKYKMKSKK
jgi:MtN3 and saliva related transmembrane protein